MHIFYHVSIKHEHLKHRNATTRIGLRLKRISDMVLQIP